MNAAHTPGPWDVVDDGRNRIEILAGDADDDGPHAIGICTVHDTQDEKANARLIAAAPKLAEALRDLCDAIAPLRGTAESIDAYDAARAALAEAGL